MRSARVVRRSVVLVIALVACSAAAQSLDFSAIPKTTPGLTNQGPVGALASDGRLGSATGVYRDGFNVVDVAVGQSRMYAVQTQPGQNVLMILDAKGDSTFGVPQYVRLAAVPTSVHVFDIDLDGALDVVVSEQNTPARPLGTGTIEVFSGRFLRLGQLRWIDRSDLAVRSEGGNPDDAFDPITVAHGRFDTDHKTLSVTVARLDGDVFGDIVYVGTDSPSGVFVEVILTNPVGAFEGRYVASTIDTTISAPAPRAIDVNVLNLGSAPGTEPDSTPDIVVATTAGIQVITTIPDAVDPINIDPTWNAPVTFIAGTSPVGVIAADVTRDGLADIINVNAGSGNISTRVARLGGGYSPVITSTAGPAPRSLSLINYQNDGIPDLLVANAPGLVAGSVMVMPGNGSGSFSIARSIPVFGLTSVAAGQLRNGSQGEDVVYSWLSGVRFLANTTNGLVAIRLKAFIAASPAGSIDPGPPNDVVVVEQVNGLVCVVRNVSDSSSLPAVQIIDLKDISVSPGTVPTSATMFRDAQTNLTNIAVTHVTGTSPGEGQLIVLVNDGTGTFPDFGTFRQFTATSGATNVQSGDFDNDGDDDLTYVDLFANTAAVFLNNGANTFTETALQNTGAAVPIAARVADVNDDDYLDVVVAHQGDLNAQPAQSQSLISVLLGNAAGGLTQGPTFTVPGFALSLAGGAVGNRETQNAGRVIDFNMDGLPDFAVASTFGGINGSSLVPSVTLLINRADSPGNFLIRPAVSLFDPADPSKNFQLDMAAGGPGLASGRAFGLIGGGNSAMSVADADADGFPDLFVSGTTSEVFDADNNGIGDSGTTAAGIPGVLTVVNFRSAMVLRGNGTAGTVSVVPPIRDYPPGPHTPATQGGDTLIANAAGSFAPLSNKVPDVFQISMNGQVWLDVNITSLNNHAPIVTIPRSNLNASRGQGRKHVITSGHPTTIAVTATDADSDTLQYQIFSTPAAPFASINANTGLITIAGTDINHGSAPTAFRITAQAHDAASSASRGAAPLFGRDSFTLVVNPAPSLNVETISPSRGSTFGGQQVTLTGTGFESGLTVTIGGVDATNVSVVSSTLITAKTGSHARGLVSVIVRNSSGAASTLVNQYRYGLFDTNSDFLVTDADLINLTDFLFLGAPAPSDTGDANGDGRVDAVDVAYLINFLRAGGPEPQ